MNGLCWGNLGRWSSSATFMTLREGVPPPHLVELKGRPGTSPGQAAVRTGLRHCHMKMYKPAVLALAVNNVLE